jgi:hypothetical protein
VKQCDYKTGRTVFTTFLTLIFLIKVFVAEAQEPFSADTLSKAFYDSLKVKAERRKLTSLLYDMIVVAPAPPGNARERMTSTTAYEAYRGRIIRNREIIRLNAFGEDIDDPQGGDPTRAERFMNSTYTKTRRFVISQHLLFRQGDSVSPLVLSDNERLLRELPFIDDARITILPVDSTQADIAVIVREKYPIGLDLRFDDLKSGIVSINTGNFAGLGHELEIKVPFDYREYKAPGIGLTYSVRNIARSFSDLKLEFSDGLGTTRLGAIYKRGFVTSDTKYAWSASLIFTGTNEDLDTLISPVPLKFTWQDYWAARSFMLDRKSVTRLIVTGRYVHNNVFSRPEIDDFSYYRLQRYQNVTGSLAVTSQRFINTSLIYSYGRTEDIPYGYMAELIAGREKNEFKWRTYTGVTLSYGNFFSRIGYLYAGAGVSAFYNQEKTEQGMVQAVVRYFTPLATAGRSRLRTFINLNYTRGFNRYADEYLYFRNDGLIRGFRNDSVMGVTRLALSLEPVLFLPQPLIGFRFAIFAFADAGVLAREGFLNGEYNTVTALGAGVRIRNDQLVMNTLQIRLTWYPNSPPWSVSSTITADGLVRLKPPRFEPGPPGVVPFL